MDDSLLIKCLCGEYSYLEITVFDDDPRTLWVAISSQPMSFRYRLKDAWNALRGKRFTVSNEVLLSDEDKKRLQDFLK